MSVLHRDAAVDEMDRRILTVSRAQNKSLLFGHVRGDTRRAFIIVAHADIGPIIRVGPDLKTCNLTCYGPSVKFAHKIYPPHPVVKKDAMRCHRSGFRCSKI
ncbi:MAG: hypothetical protein HC850_10260 [Rhodomicrobium sp.]|nr:hypothetical protein [Rhodomicrobium sp.]